MESLAFARVLGFFEGDKLRLPGIPRQGSGLKDHHACLFDKGLIVKMAVRAMGKCKFISYLHKKRIKEIVDKLE